ncbi:MULTISPECIES: D-glycero-beta-D-manno-heptose 1,7-bisphosphate 7-phosphatase [Fusobacterium]|uniref:D-glycero-beta-D-manno-heptose 1,7-bisphosphate 7-phosphatase n=1 Tax=Fusobacterium TaxID=848 RepID=UPI001477867F|nr:MULTISPECIES: D-glycero-beta-D-manno-heptose 1,7-bisphosphate 7-phosphatase [Fusobacterium]NME35995.1 D-glycero-beta-D-manno-heptose 1,7-bisphosphate 7-phosphatase [Fusobacterium sp. FSA-380-WT-3A]
MKKNKAIFLDRDGTINIDKDYMYRIEDFEFEPKADEALKILNDLGYILIVVTNQSGVARGYYTEKDIQTLHEKLSKILKEKNINISKFYYCPHHPTKGIGEYKLDCFCRKPYPGMLLKGMDEFNIDPSLSFMVGDKLSDVEAGLKADVTPVILKTRNDIDFSSLSENILVFNSLYDFAINLKNSNNN